MVFGAGDTHGISADNTKLEQRTFQEKGKRRPIILDVDDMLNASTYNTKKFNNVDCHVVGGVFTYYGAYPYEDIPPKDIISPREEYKDKDYNDDIGWGCAWRASLNLINNLKYWLAQNNIYPNQEDKKNRDVNMYDLARWNKLNWRSWMEPAENAEMLLCFIEDWYPSQKEQIHKLLGFRGLFYKGNTAKDVYLANSFRWKKVPLTNLRKYLGLKGAASKDNHTETLEKFYIDCGATSGVTTNRFPNFNEQTNPFPVNIDDGTYAMNIYGFHRTENNLVDHLFIGETHIWENQSPWVRSGWKKLEDVFSGKDILIFEIRTKTIGSSLLLLKNNLTALKGRLENLKGALTKLKTKLTPKLSSTKTSVLINRSGDCYFNATLQCLAHLPTLRDFLNANKTKFGSDTLKGLFDVLEDMTNQPTASYSGHHKLVDQCERKFRTDNFEGVVYGLFENVPPSLSQDIINFAFLKEERCYEIDGERWDTKFIVGNYPPLHEVCNVRWSGDWVSLDFLSRNKFTKEKTQRYEFPVDVQVTKKNFIENVYNKKIVLDLEKVKSEVKERIEDTYKTGAKPLSAGYTIEDIEKVAKIHVFIDALNQEEFWTKFGISPEEAKKLIPLAPETNVTLTRKIIPPIILMLHADNDYPNELLIAKQYLAKGLTSDIRYELKGILVGSGTHAWAYAKEQDDKWTEYDDEKKQSFDQLPKKFKSLKFGRQEGFAQLVFYELDPQSTELVKDYYWK